MSARALIVSLHDLHPGSLQVVRAQVADLEAIGIGNTSLLVVPEFHHGSLCEDHAETVAFLEARRAAGDDLVLHGYYHDRVNLPVGNYFWTRMYSNNEAEFYAIAEEEAERRLEAGLSLWSRRGWPVGGFIAPGWLMSASLEGVLRRLGFIYTTRLREIVSLCDGRVTKSQSLCYSTRSWWRVPMSLAWNRFLFERLLGQPVIRLGLHPGDWAVDQIRCQALELARRALELGYRPMTYQRYVTL
ncbi:MAG: DUF2334 domain-containing protein [Candidatus Methylacidiphilales bacterium]